MSHFTTFISLDNPGNAINLEAWADSYIWDDMAPFCESTEDPEYLEFEDCTEDVENGYASEKVDCFKLPNGSVVARYNRLASGFVIRDGLVYQSQAGPLKHEKRTKKARKIKALPDYPFNKLYPTVEAYAEDYCGYAYDEDHRGYGYYSNPSAFWDWYLIGGRWPFTFLVKDNCKYIVEGERGCGTENETRPAPEGYKWVAGARKRDIEWALMKSIALGPATETFFKLENWYLTGVLPEGAHLLAITEDGIDSWGDLVYKKGETLEQYLARHELGPNCQYPVSAYSYLENGEYISLGDMGWWGISSNDKPEDDWRQMTQDFIDRIPDDDFLVTVDCHI